MEIAEFKISGQSEAITIFTYIYISLKERILNLLATTQQCSLTWQYITIYIHLYIYIINIPELAMRLTNF